MYAVSSLPHHTYVLPGKLGIDRIHLLTYLRRPVLFDDGWHPVLLDDGFELILATLQATPPIIATTCPVSEVQVPLTLVIPSCVQ